MEITSSKDNTLYEDELGERSNGAGVVMFAGETNGNGSRRGLIEFDIAAAVPAGSIIDSVTLRMYCSRTSAGSRTIGLQRALQEWGESTSDPDLPGGVGAPAAVGDATWLHTFYSTNFWTTPGGDFSPTLSGATSVGSNGYYNWSASGMIADVQSWLDNPAGNHGWGMIGVESENRTAKRFDTHETSNAARRPRLTINYTIPEPASLALLLPAALIALRRR